VTKEIVAVVIGAIVSLLFEVVPGLKTAWEAWQWKRLTWLVGCFVVAFALLALCYAGLSVGFTCAGSWCWPDIQMAVAAALAAFWGGQLSYAAIGQRLRKR